VTPNSTPSPDQAPNSGEAAAHEAAAAAGPQPARPILSAKPGAGHRAHPLGLVASGDGPTFRIGINRARSRSRA